MSHLSCRICSEDFTLQEEHVPRSLTCAHTFCHSCLASWIARSAEIENKGSRNVECPTCRAPSAVPPSGFPANYALLEWLESKKEESLAISNSSLPVASGTCVECQQAATVYCSSCGDLCAGCSSSIHSSAKSHRVCDIRAKPEPPRFCGVHPGEPVKIYCQMCQVLVCGLCPFVGVHKGHEVEEMNEAAKNKVIDVVESRKTIQDCIDKNQTWIDDIKLEHSRVEVELKAVSATVTTHISQAIACLRRRESTLKQELAVVCSTKQGQLDRLLIERSAVASTLASIESEGKDLVDMKAVSLLENYASWRQKVRGAERFERKAFKFQALIPQFDIDTLGKIILRWGILGSPDASLLQSKAPAVNWRNELEVGDSIEACDTVGKWYRSTIIQVKEGAVMVHYDRWDPKWDEWLDTGSDRLAPRETHIICLN